MATLVSLKGNCYPDRLFRSARRLLHRIALNDGSRGGDRRLILIDILWLKSNIERSEHPKLA
jgi:hypothetical protein